MIDRAFREVAESVADALLVVDVDGTVVYANPAAVGLFSRDDEPLEGSHFGFPLAPGERTEIDVISVSKERRIAEMRTRRLEWDGAETFVVTVRDVTQRHALEQSLRDLVSTVSHEIRSPLATVDGLIDLVAEVVEDDDEETRHHLELMSRQVDRVLGLANRLLTFARLDADALETEAGEVGIAGLLDEICDEHEARGLKVDVEIEDGVTAWADRAHLRSIIDNYLDNAKKYGDPPFRIEVRREDDAVVLRVIDHGPGVPDDFRAKLFDRFSRAESERTDGSSGLGLPIVLGIARALGGDAWYEPNNPSGSVFAVRLPCPPEE